MAAPASNRRATVTGLGRADRSPTSATEPTTPRSRQPRLTETVAAKLRDRIISGELSDGTLLPSHEDLHREFGISMPSLREALRILEVEGLIRMKRGRGGGAVVMRPSPLQAGYLLGMVMQSRRVLLGDVLQALEDIEPICAAGCARRADREHSVLPRLRSALDAARESLEDPDAYARAARRFHTELIACCGTETTVLLVGALEALWTAHVIHLVEHVEDLGPFALREVRLETVHEHEKIFDLIAVGDVAGTEAAMRGHYGKRSPDGRARRHDIDLTMPVEANLLWSLQGSALPD